MAEEARQDEVATESQEIVGGMKREKRRSRVLVENVVSWGSYACPFVVGIMADILVTL